ncbi:MAG: hypothetical protein ACK514_02530 [Bacteroidota bacterium]|jgi:DNA-directed RNA polymerase subunit RPC12/RpoP|nr:DUF2007 domain-containing protein [Cytophagales bacterium]MCE2956813.1 DUF2007 domain-containing protein [Flammeovirgaceae bacterium]MCZ8069234.1 hypothetical protein [Cytophagales bacterium]
MEASEKIIVYQAYDNVIVANLAKTKLDAYGIPCFLTEENFTGLYPLRNDIFPGVRLHIFEKDREEVHRILAEQSETFITCPHCQSKDWKKIPKATSKFTFVALFVLLGMRAPLIDEEYECNNCGRKFN